MLGHKSANKWVQRFFLGQAALPFCRRRTRNFSCASAFAIGPGMQLSRLASPGGEYVGRAWSESAFLSITELRLAATGEYAGRVIVDTTVPGSVFVEPAPDPADLAWGRFKCTCSGPLLPRVNYVVRVDTSGGGPPPPGRCSAGGIPSGAWITEPYNATAMYFLCT